MNMDELSPDVIEFKDERSKRLYRDRFVFPEILVGAFIDNDAIVEAIEAEIKKRIQEKTVNNISNEVNLKNIFGPLLGQLDNEQKSIFLNLVGEIKAEKIKIVQEKPLISVNNRKSLSNNDIRDALAGANKFLEEEAKRAGFVSKFSRDNTGGLIPEGDAESLDKRITFD